MSTTQQLILTAPPAASARAATWGLPIGHMAYRVGKNGRLFRAQLSVNIRGGLMVVDAAGFSGQGDPHQLSHDIVRECVARKFDGILCDFDGPPDPFLEKTLSTLGSMTLQRGWNLYTTQTYASAWEHSIVLIPTLISSGSLEARLRQAIHCHGAHRVALAVQRAAQEYLLPSGPNGGIPLERGELAQRVQHFSPAVFFDHNLCAHHFTYMEQGSAHFILFDDSGSLLRKLSLARELGIRRAFLAFPEVEDILPRLLAE